MTDAHYLNLSRGLLLAADVSERYQVLPSELRVCRIQSTACEQKRWAYVLDSLNDDLLYNLALGNRVYVHDVSEKPRRTRALWQGIPWIRHVLYRRWLGVETPAILHRHGKLIDVTTYFDRAARALPRTTKRRVDYFRRFRPRVVDLRGAPFGAWYPSLEYGYDPIHPATEDTRT